MTIDLKDFYLNSKLPEPEYVRIPVHLLSQRIITLYQLESKITNDAVYAQVNKALFGLPQAGFLASEDLRTFLEPHGYVPCSLTPGLWKDQHSNLMFTLVVDDFGVRYTNKQHVDRLIQVLQQKYTCTIDWAGDRYIGLHLTWDYDQRTVDISMPGYIERALQRFSVPLTQRHETSPHEWTAPTYGSRQQYAANDNTPFLDLKDAAVVREVVGTLLYYARAVDLTMLPALGTIASQQAQPTEYTMQAVVQLLNYAASNPDAVIRYYASDMQLYVKSDASYLSETHARSRVAGYHYASML